MSRDTLELLGLVGITLGLGLAGAGFWLVAPWLALAFVGGCLMLGGLWLTGRANVSGGEA